MYQLLVNESEVSKYQCLRDTLAEFVHEVQTQNVFQVFRYKWENGFMVYMNFIFL